MKKTNLFLLFTIFIATSLFSQQRNVKPIITSKGKEVKRYQESYALIIGNGNYSLGWDPLPGALKDVDDVTIALKNNGFKVTTKKDVTRDGFDQAFGEFALINGKNKNNRLLFYFAGHGHTKEMANEEQLGYLVMIDAPDPDKDPVGFNRKSIDMEYLVTQAKMIKADHVLFMFDCCFSGTILNLRDRVAPEAISDVVKYPVRQFITAGRAHEPVPDHSYFKQAFLDILTGRDKELIPDGYLTGEELGLYLKNKVPTYNPNQHPQYGKIRDPILNKGDFVFVLSDQAYVEPEKPEIPFKTPLVTLRSQPLELSQDEIKNMLAKRDFFDENFNKTGQGIVNQFEIQTINGGGVVIDRATGLMWQRNGSTTMMWDKEAKSWINELNRSFFAGFRDWRLPTLEEAMSLMEVEQENGLHINSIFEIQQDKIWTADQESNYQQWGVSFSYGSFLYDGYGDVHYVRAVRSNQPSQESFPPPVIKNEPPNAQQRQTAEKLASDWIAAAINKDLNAIANLASMPFYFDNEIIVRTEDLLNEYKKLFEARGDLVPKTKIERFKTRTIAEFKQEGYAITDRMLKSLSLNDNDLSVEMIFSIEGRSGTESTLFFMRMIDGKLKMAGSWD